MTMLIIHEKVAGAIGIYPIKKPVAIIFFILTIFSSLEISLPRLKQHLQG